MPVGGSNALKSKTRKPRGARPKLGHPAPNLDSATTTTTTVSRVGTRDVRSQGPSNPLEVAVQFKSSSEEGKQRRPRERERDEVQGVTRKEIYRKECVKGGSDILQIQKSLILTTPYCDIADIKQPTDRKDEVQGRRKRVVRPQIPSKVEKEQPSLRQTEVSDFSKLQARKIPGDKYIPERTTELPKPVEKLRGRKKRVTVRPVGIRPQTTAKHNLVLEKTISDLYHVKCALKMDEISKKAEFIKSVVEKKIIMKIHELDDRFTFDILRAGK